LIPISYSPHIELEIQPKLLTELYDLNYNYSLENDVFNLGFKFSNVGSIPFTAKARIDIFEGSNHVFTGWTEEVPFQVGNAKRFNLYWFPYNITDDFKALLRVYYAHEIMDDGSIYFRVNNTVIPEEAIKIPDLKVYENEFVLTLKSNRDLENIILIPLNYPESWFVPQKKIDQLKEDKKYNLKIDFDPSLWKPGHKITFQAITEDGKYFGESIFELRKEGAVKTLIYYSLESIMDLFSKIYNLRK
jgi:hypothetical protein